MSRRRYIPRGQREDYVPVHQHSSADVQGLPAALFPPAQVVDGVDISPTTASIVFIPLNDMNVTVNPDAGVAPLWEVRLWFDGQFNSNDATAGVRLVEDPLGTPVVIDDTERQAQILGGPASFILATSATAVVQAGVDTVFGVEWRSSLGAVTAAVTTRRHLIAVLRPYAPAA